MLSRAPIRAYIPARDIARARKFYEQTVGLTPKEEYAGGVIYECGGTEVFMYPTDNAGTSKASQAYWEVDDVEAEVAELKARGVAFEEYDMPGIEMRNNISVGGGAKTAWFKDTEGNILAGSQRPQRSTARNCHVDPSILGAGGSLGNRRWKRPACRLADGVQRAARAWGHCARHELRRGRPVEYSVDPAHHFGPAARGNCASDDIPPDRRCAVFVRECMARSGGCEESKAVRGVRTPGQRA
jgi:predicted enzyme related to lactoylglutathione lyase